MTSRVLVVAAPSLIEMVPKGSVVSSVMSSLIGPIELELLSAASRNSTYTVLNPSSSVRVQALVVSTASHSDQVALSLLNRIETTPQPQRPSSQSRVRVTLRLLVHVAPSFIEMVPLGSASSVTSKFTSPEPPTSRVKLPAGIPSMKRLTVWPGVPPSISGDSGSSTGTLNSSAP